MSSKKVEGRPELSGKILLVFLHVLRSVFTRDSIYAIARYMPRQFRLSVLPSVTCVYCIRTAERIIEILSPSDRPIIIVFRHQGSLRKSDGFATNRGAKHKG